MRRHVVLRTLSIVPALLGVSVAVFLLVRLIPGTVVDQMVGTEGSYSEESMRAMRASFRTGTASGSAPAPGCGAKLVLADVPGIP